MTYTIRGRCADEHWHDLGEVSGLLAGEVFIEYEGDRRANLWEALTGGVILRVEWEPKP